jgi:hypothetical protein
VGTAFTSSVAHLKITAGAGRPGQREMSSAGQSCTIMPSHDEPRSNLLGTLFRKAFTANSKVIEHRTRKEWN